MDGVVVARLGELPAGAVRTLRFETRSTPAAGGALTVRALAMFDSPAKSGLRTQPIESQLNRGAARYGRSQFSFTPRFDVLKTELALSDEAALRTLINSWRGARDITIRAVGHADSQPITARSRKVYADNYALSKARAQTVADYLAISLNVPASPRARRRPRLGRAAQCRQGCRQPRRQSPRRNRHRRRALRSERAARTRQGRR